MRLIGECAEVCMHFSVIYCCGDQHVLLFIGHVCTVSCWSPSDLHENWRLCLNGKPFERRSLIVFLHLSLSSRAAVVCRIYASLSAKKFDELLKMLQKPFENWRRLHWRMFWFSVHGVESLIETWKLLVHIMHCSQSWAHLAHLYGHALRRVTVSRGGRAL
jgi:hypothetical protein